MNVTFAYRGHSDVVPTAGGGQALQLVPNLARDPVAFDAPIVHPLRFREAISALHDTVISDLRYKPRDKTAYLEWKKAEASRVSSARQQARRDAALAVLAAHDAIAPTLQKDYESARRQYWTARQQYSNYLLRHDRDLWRMLMPCDPVVTVADDVVFFECFSADESSYGCLTVDHDGFGHSSGAVQLGTTNVDYSWNLYHHFQSLRSYRQTRLTVDPAGFTTATEGRGAYREEKIDLPNGWLRGFMQIQAAMGMPKMALVSLPRETVYSILAWMKRHNARRSPRAIRIELIPGEAPRIVLEPWEQVIVAHGTTYRGPSVEPIWIWGGRRLLTLARVLPLADRFEVCLLGTGLPSFWVARMGEMRLTLGLSGWTANDWTRGSALDLLAPPAAPTPDLVNTVGAVLHQRRSATLNEIAAAATTDETRAAAALRELALTGQV